MPSSISCRLTASSTAGSAMALNDRPERHRIVDVLVAVHVPHVAALAAREEHGRRP